MAIEINEMIIKSSVDSDRIGQSDRKTLPDELEKIKNDILKECMANVVEYINRLKDR